MPEVENIINQLTIIKKGVEKASRNNPKCYSKQNQKEIQSGKKASFSRKHLSLESSYESVGISENPINLVKVGDSGDISITSEKTANSLNKKSH